MFRLKAQASKISLSIDGVNRPFPCCLLPNESLCKTIYMKMSSALGSFSCKSNLFSSIFQGDSF